MAEAPPLSVGNGPQQHEDDARVWLDQRLAIETGATVLAAERAQPADLDRLAEAIERMAAATAFEAYRRADVLFHIRVAEAAHSPRLVTAMTEVHGHMSDLRHADSAPDRAAHTLKRPAPTSRNSAAPRGLASRGAPNA